jgi:FlgD Ig-like domain
VELKSFTAKSINNTILLNWQTATEVNNNGFEIQRSVKKDGWKKIGFVLGHGNSNSLIEYSFVDNSPTICDELQYRLKKLDNDGKFTYSGIIKLSIGMPNNYQVMQNYPNPFNPSTTIKFQLPKNSLVSIKVYDQIGNEIATLINEEKTAGSHIVQWNGKNSQGTTVASGVYFYKISAGNYIATYKMNFLK